MKSNHRFLAIGFSLWTLAVICSSAWSLPLNGIPATTMPVQQEPQAQPPDQSKPDDGKPMTFTGVVVKQGEGYALRDSSGVVYQLDNASGVQQFEGKSVTVTGKLNPQTKTIHVASVEGA
jgi:hypothetical protein